MRAHGNKHLCLAVLDVPATMAVLRDKGADVVSEKVVQGTSMAFIRDNSGNLLELIHCPELWASTISGDETKP